MRAHLKRRLLMAMAIAAPLAAGGAIRIVQDQCGPFTDVSPTICPYVLEMYYLGITAGTSATTFSPDSTMTRGQAAVFVAKGINQALARSSRRAALGQWWTTENAQSLGLTSVGPHPQFVASDGADLWVTGIGTVTRVRASDGQVLGSWTGAAGANSVLVAMGRIFVTGGNPGSLYMIDPAQPSGEVATVSSTLGPSPAGLAFDGSQIWVANNGEGSISIVTPGPTLPWATNTIGVPGLVNPGGALFDGNNIWMTDPDAGLFRFDSSGKVLQHIIMDATGLPVFDGTNIWVAGDVPGAPIVTVVRASTGSVVQTLSGNGLAGPLGAAFDGQRVLVANNSGDSVSLWKAADLSPLGSVSIGSGTSPLGACSDGANFWITLSGTGQLARF